MLLITESAGGREHFTPQDAIMNVGNSWSYSGAADGIQTSPRPVQFLLTLQEE